MRRDEADGYPAENAFDVPETLRTARLRLPTGPSALALTARFPHADQLVDAEWLVADCLLWTLDERALGDLSSLLASTDTKLAFVEPTAGLGVRHRLQLAAGPWLAGRRGHRHHRDIPAELRGAGLTVTTVVRFRDGFGHYVWGEARRYTHRITTR